MYTELKEFGLSDNEIKVYVALLKTGLAPANRISKITGIKRSTTYDNLNLLANKGIVSMIMKDNVNFYQASEPSKIIRLLDERKDKIKKIVPYLEELRESASEKTGITFFEGKKGTITVLNDILEEKKELWFYGSRKMALIAQQDYPEDFIKKRAESNIALKAVLSEEDRGDPSYKNKLIYDLSNLKFLRDLDKIQTNVFIYGDKVAFMTSGENLVGVIIKNKEIVAQQRKMFKILWDKAKK